MVFGFVRTVALSYRMNCQVIKLVFDNKTIFKYL